MEEPFQHAGKRPRTNPCTMLARTPCTPLQPPCPRLPASLQLSPRRALPHLLAEAVLHVLPPPARVPAAVWRLKAADAVHVPSLPLACGARARRGRLLLCCGAARMPKVVRGRAAALGRSSARGRRHMAARAWSLRGPLRPGWHPHRLPARPSMARMARRGARRTVVRGAAGPSVGADAVLCAFLPAACVHAAVRPHVLAFARGLRQGTVRRGARSAPRRAGAGT